MIEFINLLTAFLSVAESKPAITIILFIVVSKAIFLYFIIRELKKELKAMADGFQDHIIYQKEVQKDVVNIKSSVSEINGMLKVILYEKNKY